MGTGATVATLTDASDLPGTVTVAQVNYSTVTDGEVRPSEQVHCDSAVFLRNDVILQYDIHVLLSFAFSGILSGRAELGNVAGR